MSERSNDDIADALHGLASGEHADADDHASGTGTQHAADRAAAGAGGPPGPAPSAPVQRGAGPHPSGLPRPTPKPRPSSGSPPPAPAGRAVIGGLPRAASPTQPASSASAQSTPRPASPVQAAGRVSRAATPPPANAGTRVGSPPATPGAGAAAPAIHGAIDDAETTDVQPVDDDDRVIVPAAPLSALGPKLHYRQAGPSVPLFKTLSFRRTAIPILLTSSVLMLAVAVLKYTVNRDSVLALLPGWIPVALFAAAVVFLGVAILNMVQVRQQMAAEKAVGASAAVVQAPSRA